MYYNRQLEERIKRVLKTFPVVLITGPRQAGKSTLLRELLREYNYVSLDNPHAEDAVAADPEIFLDSHPAPVIIDEIQYAPILLRYIKMRVDNNRHVGGQYVLTGSQIFQLMSGVTESLAGRVAIFDLYPFSWLEVEEAPQFRSSSRSLLPMVERIITGFYPEFIKQPNIDWQDWMDSYLTTYYERDVRQVKAIADLKPFRLFVSLLAARAGQLLNLSEVAKACGISQPTAKAWLRILEATYMVHLLPPYYKNRTKRLVKQHKLYFVDTGLLCYLLQIDSPERFLQAKERGTIFENMVIMDVLKQREAQGLRDALYFYRSKGGLEVDLLIETYDKLYAYEIKFSKAINFRMGQNLDRFAKEYPGCEAKILCLIEKPTLLTRQIQAIHWSEVDATAR